MSTVIKRPATATEQLLMLPPDQVEPWPGLNPRRRARDPQKFADLVASIRENGVYMPVVVHDRAAAGEWSGPGDGAPYWLVAGEGRWLGTKEVPGAMLPARPSVFTFERALRVALIENLQREDLSPLDEAYAYRRLLDEGGMTQAQLAETVGVKQPTIANRLRLLELPQPILELIDEGIVQQSHARDYMLPFMGIPEAKRDKLFDRVAKELRSDRQGDGAGEPLTGEVVRLTVGDVAARLSRPISGGYGADAPVFKPAAHKRCKCGGPRFKYYWQLEVRCFDDDWWKAEQQKALQAREERERKAAQKIEAGADGPVQVISYNDLYRLYSPTGYKFLDEAGHRFDPAEVADSALVVARASGVDRVVCVDKKAIARATRAANKERKALLEERIAQRAERDLEEAQRSNLEPWMLAEILCSRPYDDSMIEVGREIGLDMGKHGKLDEALRALAPEQIATFFKVLAIRCKRGDLGWQDPIKKEVDDLLRKRYASRAARLSKRILDQLGDPAADREDAKNGARARRRGDEEPEAMCVVCDCSDSRPCEDGCTWLIVDRKAGVGVCSSCEVDEQGARAVLQEWADDTDTELGVLSAA